MSAFYLPAPLSGSSSSDIELLKAADVSQKISIAILEGTLQAAITPSQPSDLVTKSYADALAGGMTWKNACRVKLASFLPVYTASGTQEFRTYTATANGPLIVDAITLAAGDRILLDQSLSNDADGGIFTVVDAGETSVRPWILRRAVDANNNPSGEVIQGIATSIITGTGGGGRQYILTTPNPIVLGTTLLTWAQFSAGQVTMDGGVTGTSSSCVVASVGGSTSSAVNTATVLANNATATNTASAIVRRSATNSFDATTINLNGITCSVQSVFNSNDITLAGVASSSANYFTDSIAGDSVYRNLAGSLRFGTSAGATALLISNGGVTANNLKMFGNGYSTATGAVGEVIESIIPIASAFSITSNVQTNITSLVLTRGHWLIHGCVGLTNAFQAITYPQGWISMVSATRPDRSRLTEDALSAALFQNWSRSVPMYSFVTLSGATVYLGTYCIFSSGTVSGYGSITATRLR